jgi:hypothetical protein
MNIANFSTPVIFEESGKCSAAEKFSRFENGREKWGGIKQYLRRDICNELETELKRSRRF